MILTVFGNTERTRQQWDARLGSPVITLVGNTSLDLRLARLAETGETELVVVVAFGSVDITVPDTVPVYVGGLTLLGDRRILGESSGGIVHGTDRATDDFIDAAGRRIRLSIFTAFGGVDVRRAPILESMPLEV